MTTKTTATKTNSTMINWDVFRAFVTFFAGAYIGRDWKRNTTTLIEEVRLIGRWIHNANVNLMVAERGVTAVIDLYHDQARAYRLAELSEDELKKNAEAGFYRAACRICQLSSTSGEVYGEKFLTGWIDKKDKRQVKQLCDEFMHSVE